MPGARLSVAAAKGSKVLGGVGRVAGGAWACPWVAARWVMPNGANFLCSANSGRSVLVDNP